MKRKTVFTLLSICILIFFTMACSISDTVGNLFNSTKLESAVYKSEAGGFSYKIPVDYDQEEDSGNVQILAPGADNSTGPIYMLIGSLTDQSMTSAELLDQVKENWTFETFTKEKKVTINGVSGLELDFSTTYNDQVLTGRIFVAMVTPTHQFMMLGGCPQDKWKTESKVFDKVLSSIKFFDPDPNAN